MFHGANLLPEGLEFGEMKVQSSETIEDLEPVYVIAFTGDNVGQVQVSQDGYRYNGIPSSVAFLVCLELTIDIVLQIINQDGNGDKILNVFSIPKLAVKSLIPVDPPRNNDLLVASPTRPYGKPFIHNTYSINDNT